MKDPESPKNNLALGKLNNKRDKLKDNEQTPKNNNSSL
jgi:hypothetical protein